MQRLKGEPKRVHSQGMMVLSDKWATSKATRLLIEEEIKTKEHVPVQRKRQTTDAFEDGFLVIGNNAITFLSPDKKILASHPTAFLETYSVDLHNSKMLTYTIKQVHFLKKDDIMTFSFVARDEEVAKKLVRRLDRFVLASFRKDENALPVVYQLDRSKEYVGKAEDATSWLSGERFVVQRSVVNAEKMELLSREKREDAIAIFHPRGIVVLSAGASNGLMEAFSYKAMKSFGATDESCFGFRVSPKNVEASGPPKSPRGGKGENASDDVFVCLPEFVCKYSEESAHLQNALLMRYARRWEEMKERNEEPLPFPSTYSTSETESL